MIALIQRVTEASVSTQGEEIAKIGAGLLLLLGVEPHDDEGLARRLADKVLSYRVFSDENGKMNLDLRQQQGELLIVSQFTVAANTDSGRRPSFTSAAKPELARHLYNYFSQYCRAQSILTQQGQFAADMQVKLINDGPVTFWLQV